jgi:hypothetical protein
MSGAIIYTPDTGDDWASAWQQVEYARKGKLGLSLTHYDDTSLPAVAAGSWAEVVGSIYKWASEEAISGSLTGSAINYIKLVPGGSGDTAIVTATWTDSAPTWSDSYQGWYSGTSRYVGGCYYDGSNYYGKWVYNKNDSVEHSKGSLSLGVKVIEIGDWNMDSTATKNIAHGLLLNNIRTIQGTIRDDGSTTFYPLMFSPYSTYSAVTVYCDATNAVCDRQSGSIFDSALFDATSFNRGWITIWYEL